MTTTDTPTAEIAIVVPEREQLPPSLLANIETGFREAFAQAEKWRVQALAINVTSADQKTEMKMARAIRLTLKEIRVSAEKTRKSLKEDALRMGKAIDGVNNLLLAAIVPLEKHLEEQERYGERLAEAERLRLHAERAEAIAPYVTPDQPLPVLTDLTQEQWDKYLADLVLLAEARVEAARKAEAERIAREQAEAAERERLRIENERLRAEAAQREAKAKAEREAAEKAQREAAAKAKAERDALEAAAKKEREEAERKLAAERAAAAERQRIADEAAAKERAAIQAKADAERKEAQAAMDAANAAREKMEREAREKNAAEAARIKAELLAKQKANRAPDKQKALAFAATVRTLKAPTATTEEGKAVMAEITAKIEGFAKWITVQAESL